MLKALGRIAITLVVVLALLAAGAWYVVTQTNLLANPATDVLINSGVVTGRVHDALIDNDQAIADKLGISASQVDSMVEGLNIRDWKTADLPENATPTEELSFDYEGAPVTATLYDSPEYVTLSVGGQQLTFKVSESTEEQLRLLQALR